MSIELERGSGIEQSKNLLIKNFEGPAMFLGEHGLTLAERGSDGGFG